MSDRMDDVLSSIDEALAGADEDWTVSGDAMRWVPPGEPREEKRPVDRYTMGRASYHNPPTTRVRWCPEIANPAAPTVAGLDAGIDLTDQIARAYPPPGSIAAEVEALQERLDDLHRNLAERMGCTVEEVREFAATLGGFSPGGPPYRSRIPGWQAMREAALRLAAEEPTLISMGEIDYGAEPPETTDARRPQ